jgi:hypothetical protein
VRRRADQALRSADTLECIVAPPRTRLLTAIIALAGIACALVAPTAGGDLDHDRVPAAVTSHQDVSTAGLPAVAGTASAKWGHLHRVLVDFDAAGAVSPPSGEQGATGYVERGDAGAGDLAAWSAARHTRAPPPEHEPLL